MASGDIWQMLRDNPGRIVTVVSAIAAVTGVVGMPARPHRKQAIGRAEALRLQLLTRRPGVSIENQTQPQLQPETVQ